MKPAFRRKFQRLTEEWKKANKYSSSTPDHLASYQKIIKMGEPVLPLIFEELDIRCHLWFGALHTITGASPVPPKFAGNISQMRKAWLQWAKENGYYPRLRDTPKFKYFNDYEWIINYFLRTGADLKELCFELDADLVDFPLDPRFKRPGDFWISSTKTLYHVLDTGECLKERRDSYLPSYVIDYPYYSSREFDTLRTFIAVFGYKNLSPVEQKRYEWFIHQEDLRRCRIDSLVSSRKFFKGFK